ncbi:inner-membrane translocator [Alkaliphilus metalliredigens QYMF]|uniref:Inner-membrane translocator n=1 Tax=Alkaliphilus metalliredigens (strain QYMF) TaxID=293826 RepID=A6TU37_ALKMQ|nr:ABC transporter permease [Alkaliphilus metalliredigens]ABR49705.1 inner-membrane translocator [Alkaliphilus metalliredigens QYMF]
MDTVYSMLVLTLIFSTPIIITSLGGLFSERSGVVNIALEGLMMFGGFGAATAVVFLGNTPVAPWLALVVGMILGTLVSIIHAYLSINLNADQIISGTAINLLATGGTIYLAQIIFGQQRTANFTNSFRKTTYPVLSDIPVIGNIFFRNIYPTVYLAFALVLIGWYVLYKTPFGLRLRATGEHPHAVDSMGISVKKMRYIGVMISGALAGLGGGILVLTQDTQYTVMSISGTGFIALAALIFGRWRPAGILGASLFFGFSRIFSIYSNSFSALRRFPNEFFFALPYLLTIVALVIFSSQSVGPKAAGKAYDKGER